MGRPHPSKARAGIRFEDLSGKSRGTLAPPPLGLANVTLARATSRGRPASLTVCGASPSVAGPRSEDGRDERAAPRVKRLDLPGELRLEPLDGQPRPARLEQEDSLLSDEDGD